MAVAGQFVASFNGLYNIHAFDDFTEDSVVAIEPWSWDGVKKNWEPPVLRPAFAIENIPGLSCLRRRAEGSQGIFQPGPPVPALRAIGSAECGQPP
jgi:hypothetical protein